MMDWVDMMMAPTRETSRSSQGTVAARQTVRMFSTALGEKCQQTINTNVLKSYFFFLKGEKGRMSYNKSYRSYQLKR